MAEVLQVVIGLAALALGVVLLAQAARWGPEVGWWTRVPEGRFKGFQPLLQGLVNLVLGLLFLTQGLT